MSEQVQKAVKRVLDELSSEGAPLRAGLAKHDALAGAAALLKRLANTQRPLV
jgi:hypothetical protein